MSGQKYCIFDLDNCLADDGWRIDLIDWNQSDLTKRYEAYHAACARDEREDIVEMYRSFGIKAEVLKIHDRCAMTSPSIIKSSVTLDTNFAPLFTRDPLPLNPIRTAKTADDILYDMADTYRERGKVYGDNYKRIAPIVKILWPNGVPPELVVTDQWHLFELILVKLSRFAMSDLTHVDSVHDAAVYGAMIEAALRSQQDSFNK